MASRLEWPAQLTGEDGALWVQVENRARCWIWNQSNLSDRRDAEQMFKREGFRRHCAELNAPAMRPGLWWRFFGKST